MKNVENILSKCDHTLLSQTSTWEEIQAVCDDGVRYGVASVCIPPCFVQRAKKYVGEKLKICTVIGFPNGYNSTAVKVFEAKTAVKEGADEIDMVLNLGDLRAGKLDEVTAEIRAVKRACRGKLLKVIIETCLLSEEEKLSACRAVSDGGADFIKTSTGFSVGGATEEDVRLLKANVKAGVLVKAAGGISGIEDAQRFLDAGADRLGTSRVVKAVKGLDGTGY